MKIICDYMLPYLSGADKLKITRCVSDNKMIIDIPTIANISIETEDYELLDIAKNGSFVVKIVNSNQKND